LKFNKTIREIQDNNDFFNIDYEDVLKNFDVDVDDNDEKVNMSMKLSLVNVAFVDAIRGIISRPKFIDKILDIYRHEWIEDLKYRIVDKDNNDKINS
jgi:hypothetical protein